MNEVQASIAELRRRRPRDRYLRASFLALLLLMAGAWVVGENLFGGGDPPFSARRLANLKRFLGEMRPFPIQQGEGLASLPSWAVSLFSRDGLSALINTVGISIAAIVLAAVPAFLLAPLASRIPAPGQTSPHRASQVVAYATRGVFLLARAVPEYILAFLLVAMIGPHPWALVLALAAHNFGILGRLGGETMDDVPPATPDFFAAGGLPRWAVFFAGILPVTLTRLLVYFFYRWETCIRDATVLGMLGFATFGFFITEARARLRYDEMGFFIVLSILVIATGDALSRSVRRAVR